VSAKITPDHLGRTAVVYVRQSTMSQVTGNLESQRRQYDLAGATENAGFVGVTVIDDDLGRSGSGSMHRPGFERLVAMVCSGNVGAVYCIEASRLARNGRDWHHLIDLCALAGALVIDPDGAYDRRLVNDRLLLGLKGTMSEYELSLLRQRGIAARDSKARRGEYRFMLPPGFCWTEAGKIEIDPDEHVVEMVRLVFAKFRELGSARQVFLWLRSADLKMPVVLRNIDVYKLIWKAPAYHSVMQILHNPLYAGATLEVLERIAALFAIESSITGRSPERRVAVRTEHAAPRLIELKTYLEVSLSRISGKSDLAKAIRYSLSRWTALTSYLNDGRLEMSNNAAERAMKPPVLGRKNYLFCGSDTGGQRAACFYTIIETAKLNGVNPGSLHDGHPPPHRRSSSAGNRQASPLELESITTFSTIAEIMPRPTADAYQQKESRVEMIILNRRLSSANY
jgi:DNA invertase Pin-like site-specific DNA recombinase